MSSMGVARLVDMVRDKKGVLEALAAAHWMEVTVAAARWFSGNLGGSAARGSPWALRIWPSPSPHHHPQMQMQFIPDPQTYTHMQLGLSFSLYTPRKRGLRISHRVSALEEYVPFERWQSYIETVNRCTQSKYYLTGEECESQRGHDSASPTKLTSC